MHIARTPTWMLASLVLLLGIDAPTPPNVEQQVGDADTSYASVEFTADGRYMVWFEGVNGNRTGKMWHCAIDDAGDLDPPDCKGFEAFPTTAHGRANVGYDAKGPFYVGANPRGEVVLVRPTGPKTGEVRVLDTPADPRRKGYYPTQDEDSDDAYVVWMRMEGDERELQYIDLAAPKKVHTVERQSVGRRIRLTPMEIGFFRVVRGRPWLTYGAFDDRYKVQVKLKDLGRPDEPARFVTDGAHSHVDPYGFVAPDGQVLLVAGIDAKATLFTYAFDPSTHSFTKQREIHVPKDSGLTNPTMATSFEPLVVDDHLWGAYQVNDSSSTGGRRSAGNGYLTTAFQHSGEVWLVDLTDPKAAQVRLTGPDECIRTEPEPLQKKAGSWVYMNAAPLGSELLSATWQLRRTKVQ